MEKLIVAVCIILAGCVSDVEDSYVPDVRVIVAANSWSHMFPEDAVAKASRAQVILHPPSDRPGMAGWVYEDVPREVHLLGTLNPKRQCDVVNHEVLHSLRIYSGLGGDSGHCSPAWREELKKITEQNCGMFIAIPADEDC